MNGPARRVLLVIFAAFFLVAGPGCSRKFFRERADEDVAGVITQKNRFPAWAVKNWHVYPDPHRTASPTRSTRIAHLTRPTTTPHACCRRTHSIPHKKSGVGRVDGEGYVHLLEQWDAENRTTDERGARRAAATLHAVPRMPPRFRTEPTCNASARQSTPCLLHPHAGRPVDCSETWLHAALDGKPRRSARKSRKFAARVLMADGDDTGRSVPAIAVVPAPPGTVARTTAGTASVAREDRCATDAVTGAQTMDPKEPLPAPVLVDPKDGPKVEARMSTRAVRFAVRLGRSRSVLSEHSTATSRAIASRSIRLSNWD